MPLRRTLATLLVALLLVTAGCSGAVNDAVGGDGAPSDGNDAANGAPHGDAEEAGDAGGRKGSSDGSGDESVDAAFGHERKVVRSGEVVLEVDDYDAARTNIAADVRARGGYVSDSTERVHGHDNETWTSGTLVLRVPAEEFGGAIERLRSEGEVVSVQTASDDVTDRLVDIEARLNNLRAERDRLRALYEEANKTADVLAIQRELSSTQEEIERLEAQQRSLENRVAYATITVRMNEEEPERFAATAPWYETSVVAAFLRSVEGVGAVLRALVVGAAYAAPYALAFGGPLLAGAFFLRRYASGARAGRGE